MRCELRGLLSVRVGSIDVIAIVEMTPNQSLNRTPAGGLAPVRRPAVSSLRWAPCGLGRDFSLNWERCCEERILHLRCSKVHGLV
jgi:hypothetical protein